MLGPMKRLRGFVVSHTHWDRAWYLSFQQYRVHLVALVDGLELVNVEVDDDALDPSEWLIASVPGGERPQVEFRLVGHGIDSTVTLPGGSPAVVRVDADKPAPIARFPIDLNRQGRSDEPW